MGLMSLSLMGLIHTPTMKICTQQIGELSKGGISSQVTMTVIIATD
jgi:hypothetical protein